jgi:hypothetical protein
MFCSPGLARRPAAIISSDYYLRLEQGRDTRPSAQVIDALARVPARHSFPAVAATA